MNIFHDERSFSSSFFQTFRGSFSSKTMSTSTAQLTKSAVTLKGSAQLVSEFFKYGLHSILYQRGIYPAESFTRAQEYGLTLFLSQDKEVNKFLEEILKQIHDWLQVKKVKKLVLVLTSVDTKEVLERWEFQVEYEQDSAPPSGLHGDTSDGKENPPPPVKQTSDKDLKKIKAEIRDVIRQITASVTFLPLLDCLCSFDVLIYTNKDISDVPETWGDSDACIIQNSEEVKLRSFSTGIHKVDAAVSYKSDL